MRFLVFTTSGSPVTEFISEAKECLYSDVFNHTFVGYYIELEDLSSLLSLIKDYPIILDRVEHMKDFEFEIEIYNDYRE